MAFKTLVKLGALQFALAAPFGTSTVEPSVATILPVSTGEALQVRQWETPPGLAPAETPWVGPVWMPSPSPQSAWSEPVKPPIGEPIWTPPPQSWAPTPAQTVATTPVLSNSPMPEWSYEETHNDSQNTKIHGIIAAIAICSLVGVGLIGVLVTVLKRKCAASKAKTHERIGSVDSGEHASLIG